MKHTDFRQTNALYFPSLLAQHVSLPEWKRECAKIYHSSRFDLTTSYIVQNPDDIGCLVPPAPQECMELDVNLNVLTATYTRDFNGQIDRIERATVYYLVPKDAFGVIDTLQWLTPPVCRRNCAIM